MILYHAKLKSNLDSIREKGINPEFARGAEKVIWLHTRSKTEWAILHTQKRYKCPFDDIAVLSVQIPRSRLTRRWRGIWTTSEVITNGKEIYNARF